ncbi:MAG: bifunctional diguanylate cyclase/phosphodiesterase [Betaproteobacteria bacterium]|nr:bifunctional diguanylate cyclase/phosphodiesterase [Betaproteobacteria bacterium]
MRIRTFIFAASAVVALLFFGGSYWTVGRIFDSAVKENARQASDGVARVTFATMYELMSTGWRRPQAESFLSATREASRGSAQSIQIYRSELVIDRFGEIDQPPLDDELTLAIKEGRPRHSDVDGSIRHIYPLVAEEKCLRCHRNAAVGSTLGAIEVRQELAPLLAQARRELVVALSAFLPLALLFAAVGVWVVSHRLERSVRTVSKHFDEVNSISDLRHISLTRHDLGFVEFNGLLVALDGLVDKLRGIAVDKDLLKFEIGLLEKFIITSDVVKDWREYVGQLLVEINRIMTAHVLFSVFKIDDELFDLEVFWHYPPTPETREMIEKYIRSALAAHSHFSEFTTCTMHHNIVLHDGGEIRLSEHEVDLRVKSFFVELPKIGGIVGIGVHSSALDDETRHLVMDSVLSTLLNVVGSVKAIYKYTHDLEYYATRDPLTDLFNQRVFWELIGYEIVRAQRQEYSFGLLLIDLDHFKLINDNYGHPTGDRYLQQFARTVQHALRGGDIFARYGGDEFVVLLPDADLEVTATIAQRVLEATSTMVLDDDDRHIHGTGSIGLAIYPDHADNAKDLFLFADNMMYRAKAAGRDRLVMPTPDDVVNVFRDISQKSVMILDAIEQRRVTPYFQPILDVQTRRIVGYEVLSRIEIGDSVVRAEEFVEIAEKMGVIHRLDTLVIELALNSLREQGHDEGYIFINLSPRALILNEFAKNVRRIVADSGVSPERIVFEITERDTVKSMGLLERFLADLKLEGFKLAIDDFGSGFSSFHYLRRFPIDFLKIEGEFIGSMLTSSKDRAFVHSIRSLALELGITMVAEYVETQEVLEELGVLGIHLAQGYYVGRPSREILPADWSPAPDKAGSP